MQVAVPYKSDLIASDEVISNWWLMHFIGREPLQVAMWPPCNHADALAFNPTAIAAEPIKSTIKELQTNETKTIQT